jgi:hypothetical protein
MTFRVTVIGYLQNFYLKFEKMEISSKLAENEACHHSPVEIVSKALSNFRFGNSVR